MNKKLFEKVVVIENNDYYYVLENCMKDNVLHVIVVVEVNLLTENLVFNGMD